MYVPRVIESQKYQPKVQEKENQSWSQQNSNLISKVEKTKKNKLFDQNG